MCERTGGMLLLQSCVNTAAYVRKIRINDSIKYPLMLSLYSHWRYGIPMVKVLCETERRCVSYLRNSAGGRATFVCICRVVCTRRYEQVVARMALASDIREIAVQ